MRLCVNPSVCLLVLLSPLALPHVVTKFSDVEECQAFFLDGQTPDIPGILVNGNVQEQNRYKAICQRFLNGYRFATLYDTENRIPVFSAYTYTGIIKGTKSARPRWMVEPQLDGGKGMQMAQEKKELNYTHQAINSDYFKNSKGVNRGHIFPKGHAADVTTANSTFTLTNVVPQVVNFNNGSWCRMEKFVKSVMDDHCQDNNGQIKAYVVTGALPGNDTLKNRVNVPVAMWTAFCCYESKTKLWVSKGHWALNVEESCKTKDKTIPAVSLNDLYGTLSQTFPGVRLFPDRCLSDLDVSGQRRSPVAEEGESKECVCDAAPWGILGRTGQHSLPLLAVLTLCMMGVLI